MTSDQHNQRWMIVAGALIIQASLGAVYIWSVFQTPLLAQFPGWSETQVTLPAQLVIAVFAFSVILGGGIQDRLGPRLVGSVGGLILGLGLILAGLTGRFSEGPALAWLIGTYAVLGGIGIGMAYVCPVATCVKWFPNKRGLITGLAVAGFGAGAFFFAPLARALIGGGERSRSWAKRAPSGGRDWLPTQHRARLGAFGRGCRRRPGAIGRVRGDAGRCALAASVDEVTIEVTVRLGGSLLEMEATILEASNAVGRCASEEALGRFDTDGRPIRVGETKLTASVSTGP